MLSKNKLKSLKKFQQKKTRIEENKFLIEGPKLLEEAIKSSWTICEVFHTESFTVPDELNTTARQLISERDLQTISNLSQSNQVAALVEIPEDKSIDWKQGVSLVLDGVSDPGNLGTIIRTATWFGIKNILCDIGSVETYNPKVVQSSMGAIFHCNVIQTPLASFLEEMKKKGLPIIIGDLEGDSPSTINGLKNGFIVMGSESHGISEQIKAIATAKVSIPRGKDSDTESLNVSVATSILCYELRRGN